MKTILCVFLVFIHSSSTEQFHHERWKANDLNEKILANISTENELHGLSVNKTRCSTLSCVHSSAVLLQKIDLDIKPCDDFYEFACGAYIAEQHTPDEKSTVDTLRYMYEQLIEYLLRLFEHPNESTTTQKIHKYAQNFFDSCMDTSNFNYICVKIIKLFKKSYFY